MNAKVLFFLLWPSATLAQGFAGLGTDVDGFANPQPNPEFSFPRDHGPHPDYRIEWWYVTANMTGPDGTDYGLQWTLFRSALEPTTRQGWSDPQIWLGHAAVTTPDAHFVAERYGRGGVGQAGVTAAPFAAWIDEWALQGDRFDQLSLTAGGRDFHYDVDLAATGPLIFQGQDGYSVKSAEGQASYYYSQPFYELSGAISLLDQDIPVTGQAWLDREWSSQPLGQDQTGWDWFSLSFDDGTKLMAFQLRQTDGAPFTSGTWITADGNATPLPHGAVEVTPQQSHQVSGHTVPVTWQVLVPDHGVDTTISAVNPDAWMATSIPYWEGPVRITGTHTGVGYLEMTGYDH
ncbi:lipocalin-like domain-containing protein [Aestuariibius sp. HNIBRBA575]|uniref:lipocalin-like domain-containing protein n=1 Tax=Aestuariibius sp. HNIBRBA575 TaxID=3233343 RepID=UPI0034A1D336